MIETKNTLKVLDMLKRYTDKKVCIKDINELSEDPVFSNVTSYLGTTCEGPDSIIVYLNFSYPNTCEATFVHEILHIILHYEGFPCIVVNEDIANALPSKLSNLLPRLRNVFSSTIEHPEIFRRMNSDFDLNLASYYKTQVQQKLNRFRKSLNNNQDKTEQYYFFRQQDILVGLEYFFYPQDYKEQILSAFREFYPDAYMSCLALYNKVKRIGFNTPRSTYNSAKIIKEHIIKYGKKKSIGTLNKVWEALEIKL